MYRLCLTSAVLIALGTGTSLAQGTSTPAADTVAAIDSAAPTALDSSSTAVAASNPNAGPVPAVANDAQSTRATKRSMRRHNTPALANTPAPTKTVETAPSKADEIVPAKTVELKDTGERTKCEEISMPGSRIVVEKRCHTYNINDRSEMKLADEKKEQTKQTLAELQRMQDNLEREQRQREWDRERAIAAMIGGAH